jgi:hypothetical protein
MFLKSAMKARLTANVSVRFLGRIVARPVSSRVMPAIAFVYLSSRSP